MTADNQSQPLLPEPMYANVGDEQLYTAGQMREYGDARAVHARRAALEEAAKVCDSAGHHWSGAPALAFFDTATKIRGLLK